MAAGFLRAEPVFCAGKGKAECAKPFLLHIFGPYCTKLMLTTLKLSCKILFNADCTQKSADGQDPAIQTKCYEGTMRSGNHSREPADGASRCVYRICSLMPEQISGRRNLLCKEIRKPRYHGRALDRALMRGRIRGNPGGTAINERLCRPGILNRIPGCFYVQAYAGRSDPCLYDPENILQGANDHENRKIH